MRVGLLRPPRCVWMNVQRDSATSGPEGASATSTPANQRGAWRGSTRYAKATCGATGASTSPEPSRIHIASDCIIHPRRRSLPFHRGEERADALVEPRWLLHVDHVRRLESGFLRARDARRQQL